MFMLGASSPPEQQGQAPEEELSLEAQFTRAQARVCPFCLLVFVTFIHICTELTLRSLVGQDAHQPQTSSRSLCHVACQKRMLHLVSIYRRCIDAWS